MFGRAAVKDEHCDDYLVAYCIPRQALEYLWTDQSKWDRKLENVDTSGVTIGFGLTGLSDQATKFSTGNNISSPPRLEVSPGIGDRDPARSERHNFFDSCIAEMHDNRGIFAEMNVYRKTRGCARHQILFPAR